MKVVFVKIETLFSHNYAYFLVLKYTIQFKLKRLFKNTYIDRPH